MATDATAPDAVQAPAVAAGEVSATRSISKRRHRWVNALIVFTTLLALVGMLSVFANRLLFDPDNWETTSTQLLQNPTIRTATANYLVDQLYANVNVAALLKTALPSRFQGLAGPAAGALRNVAVQGTELALSRPRIQSLWATANRAADQAFIAVVNGGKGALGVKNGVVTLDLASMLDTVATRLGLPAGIADKLPPSIANLTILRSNQIKLVQNVGSAIKSLALWLTILVPLLYALAIVLARGYRRRTLMNVGFAIVFAGVVGVAGRSLLESRLTDSLVSDAAARPAVRATIDIGTGLLGEIAGAFLLVGAVIVVAAWFAGPSPITVPVRRAMAPFLRERPIPSFAITAGLMLLVFIWDPIPATGTPVGIVVFLLLALLGTEALRRQTAVEFPAARGGEATAAVRAKLEALRARRHRTPGAAPAPAPATGLPDQLERLVALRDSGALTREEYDAAKASLLGS